MIAALELDYRRVGGVLLGILAVGLCKQFGIIDFGGMTFFALSLFFVYRLNVEDRKDGTWKHFQTLPISFQTKIVSRVVTPFVLLVAVQAILQHSLLRDVSLDSLIEFSVRAGVLVLASLTSTSLVSCILHFLFWAFIAKCLETIPGGGVFAVGLALALSIYYLSDKRLSFGRTALTGAIASAVLVALLGLTGGLPERDDDFLCIDGDCIEMTSDQAHEWYVKISDEGTTYHAR